MSLIATSRYMLQKSKVFFIIKQNTRNRKHRYNMCIMHCHPLLSQNFCSLLTRSHSLSIGHHTHDTAKSCYSSEFFMPCQQRSTCIVCWLGKSSVQVLHQNILIFLR